MTDYLITRYNDKIQASRALMEDAIAKKTTIYNDDCAEIIATWQADAVAAGIELQTEMDARNRTYVQGPEQEPNALPKAEHFRVMTTKEAVDALNAMTRENTMTLEDTI